MSRNLAAIQHAGERALLGRRDGQDPVVLDGDPALGVGAVEGGKRGLPGVGRLVALVLVDVVRDSPERGADEVVGELLALGGGPLVGTRLCVASPWLVFHRRRQSKGRKGGNSRPRRS